MHHRKWRNDVNDFRFRQKFRVSENFKFCWISKICSSIVSNVKKSWILKAFCFCVIDVERVSRIIHFIKTSTSSRFNLGIWLVHWRTTYLLLSRWPLSSLYLGNVQIHILGNPDLKLYKLYSIIESGISTYIDFRYVCRNVH